MLFFGYSYYKVPMDIFYLLKNLNNKQRQAVSYPRKNLLILAGAGSGKTRVLVHRIAWLQSVENCSPCSIIAVTFTNKAATEMRSRISKLINTCQNGMWIGTFHSLTHRLLRHHYTDAGLVQNFQILDNEDQLRLLKRLLKDMNLDEKRWNPIQARKYINSQKEAGVRPYNNIQRLENLTEKTWQLVYQVYQEACNRSGLVDFSELLLRSYELWINKPNILNLYQERFANILVDEFQDTSGIQYSLIRLLAGKTGNVMAVGDDDQSIYSWRGAQISNVYDFLEDFPSTKIIHLEQNYRSTSNILTVTNELIKNNNGRFGKRLWTNNIEGEPIFLYRASNELDEAYFVADRIKMWANNKGRLDQCAILYRKNSQSRVLEEALLREKVPYYIHGSVRFFERQEIKNALSYLRLIVNRNDDSAFERIINIPTRGIGTLTFEKVRQESYDRHLTLWDTCRVLLEEKVLPKQAANALQHFVDLINTIDKKTFGMPLHIQTERVIKDSGLWAMYVKEKTKKGLERTDNLEELITATRQFVCNRTNTNLISLQEFLSQVSLGNEEDQETDHKHGVALMTIHSSKGLEFPQVFIVGMEEGVFPNQMSLNENGRLEEERRLAYVGMTRAIEQLTLSYAEFRKVYGKEISYKPSRFIKELPEKCIKEVYRNPNTRYFLKHQSNVETFSHEYNANYELGQHVRHIKFGEGTITKLEGNGKKSRLQVTFHKNKNEVKWLVAAYARLEHISLKKK